MSVNEPPVHRRQRVSWFVIVLDSVFAGLLSFTAIGCGLSWMDRANPNGADALRRAGKVAVALRRTVTANAEEFAKGLTPVLAEIRAQGHVTLRAMAAELNRRGMKTRRDRGWQVSNVRNLVGRLG